MVDVYNPWIMATVNVVYKHSTVHDGATCFFEWIEDEFVGPLQLISEGKFM